MRGGLPCLPQSSKDLFYFSLACVLFKLGLLYVFLYSL